MGDSSFAIGNFTGGEISAFSQGRFDKPDYRNSMRVCLNSHPVEIGAHVRRPGSQYGGHTKSGNPGRVIKFDFEQSAPVTIEFTDGFLRFRNGASLITTNDPQVIVAISAANPAVVQTTTAHGWSSGNTVIFSNPTTPLLENRQFVMTVVDTTHVSLADALTGATIDGSTLGAIASGATISRVHELVTSYAFGSWSTIRAVQAETTDILLDSTVAPQAVTVPTLPAVGVNPVFAINPVNFIDGPYLDPFTNGVQAGPSALTGVITITLSFQAYSATTSYTVGAFVTSSSVNYVSLVDQNVGNTPASSPTQWATTSASAGINNGQGFLGTDIGRLIRLFSEPPLWAVGTTYGKGGVANVVTYNPSGLAGQETYWESLTTGNVGNIPGTDLTNWELIPQGASLWTWGRITGLSNIISPSLSGSVNIGTMTSDGGVAAAFNNVFSQTQANSAVLGGTAGGNPAGTIFRLDCYVGKNYTGASAQKIQSATVYPSSDNSFANGSYISGGNLYFYNPQITLRLRAKATAPASAADGTLLATTTSFTRTFAPVTLVSNDQNTTWNYVWIEMITTFQNAISMTSGDFFNTIAQVSFFNPTGSGTGAACNMEILGPALLFAAPVQTWRLGVYSGTTGYPTCGVYNDGRLYLGGAVGNRFDACVSNGINGSTINFAPTDQYGVVSNASAISYTFNSKGVNQILWMKPDLQGVLMGTIAGEWLVQAPTAGSIAPTNITARNVTDNGSANIEPVNTEHTLVFVKRFARKLLEFFPDVFSGKFSAPNLADKAQHLTRNGVAELAYTSAVTPIIWGRDTLGALFGITYKRDSLASSQPPTFYGWHHHALGSGRIVESICGGPSTGGNLDALTMVTNDPVTNIRHVEVMTDVQDELTPLAASWYLDDAVNPTSTSTTNIGLAYGFGGLTINGLWHLNGKTVQVFAGGLDCGDPGEGKAFSDFVVTNGSITVPYGDGISAGPGRGLFTAAFATALPLTQIVVGFTYNSDGQLVRPISPADSGARSGPAFGKLTRAHRYAFKLVNTLGLSVGGTFANLAPVNTRLNGNGPALPALTTFSGISADALKDDPNYDNAICWRVARPFPANIVAVGCNLATSDQ
jgi:hypothetical protein